MNNIGFVKTNRVKKVKKVEAVSSIVDVNFTHTCIIGGTGSGKTSAMINPNLDHRLKLGHGVLVFDHKGNYHTTVKALAKRHKRLDDVIVVGEPWGKSCNIIEDMNKSSMVDFLQSVVTHSKDNKFWEQSAINLAQPILNLLKSIERLENDKYLGKFIKSFLKHYRRDLASLYKITTHRDSLRRFNDTLKSIIINTYDNSEFTQTLQTLVEDYDKDQSKETEKTLALYSKLLELYERFENECINTKYMDTRSQNTFDSVMTSLNSPLGPLAKNPYINGSDININSALNSGKIVVFLCNQLPEVALASITKSIFQNFNERIGDKSHKDISIFIDEAQRVLNKDVDLPIDTLREARVDVFLAFQSKSLLIDKIGQEKTDALNVNLTSKYYLKNSNNDDGILTKDLEPFTFLTNKNPDAKPQKAKPIFLEEKELFEAEYAYQMKVNAFVKYEDTIPYNKKRYIMKFIPSLYDNGKISIMHEDGKIEHFEIVPSLSQSDYKQLKEILFYPVDRHQRKVERKTLHFSCNI